MAAAPYWKVYDAEGKYQAACKEVEAAAALLGFYGDGATIRALHTLIVWTEGKETQPAGESFDHVAEVAVTRLRAHLDAKRGKRGVPLGHRDGGT